MKMQSLLGGIAAGLLTLTAALPVQAWEPKKPINIVVGFSPGGGTDIIAREEIGRAHV